MVLPPPPPLVFGRLSHDGAWNSVEEDDGALLYNISDDDQFVLAEDDARTEDWVPPFFQHFILGSAL